MLLLCTHDTQNERMSPDLLAPSEAALLLCSWFLPTNDVGPGAVMDLFKL